MRVVQPVWEESEGQQTLHCCQCIVLIIVLLLWQHGDMTGIPPQMVHSYKGFNGATTTGATQMKNVS